MTDLGKVVSGNLEARIIRLELERDARLTFDEARDRTLKALDGARQANVRPTSVMGNLFSGDPATRERRMVHGVQVIALDDFNAALDAAFPGDDDPRPARPDHPDAHKGHSLRDGVDMLGEPYVNCLTCNLRLADD